jgi:hypothetical protein
MTDLEKLEKEHAEMGETIKRMKEGKNKSFEPWVPKTNETCFTIFGNGSAVEIAYRDCFNKEHQRGLIFKTKQEALDFDRRRVIQTKLQRLADKMWTESGEVLDWSDTSQHKHYLFYDYSIITPHFIVGITCCYNSRQTVFPRRTTFADITAEIPEADLKFLWGVE